MTFLPSLISASRIEILPVMHNKKLMYKQACHISPTTLTLTCCNNTTMGCTSACIGRSVQLRCMGEYRYSATHF